MNCIECHCKMTNVKDIKRTYYTRKDYRCSGCRSKGSMTYNRKGDLIDFKWKVHKHTENMRGISNEFKRDNYYRPVPDPGEA